MTLAHVCLLCVYEYFLCVCVDMYVCVEVEQLGCHVFILTYIFDGNVAQLSGGALFQFPFLAFIEHYTMPYGTWRVLWILKLGFNSDMPAA